MQLKKIIYEIVKDYFLLFLIVITYLTILCFYKGMSQFLNKETIHKIDMQIKFHS